MTDSTPDATNYSKLDISLAGIEEATKTIDRVFRNTPQFVDEQLSAALGRHVLVKVETANPVRSFKGRGADFMMRRLDRGQRVVCSSTGNLGQAMAYTGRRRGIAVEVFVPVTINPVKLARMKAFGAHVRTLGDGVDRKQPPAGAAERLDGVKRSESVFRSDARLEAFAWSGWRLSLPGPR